MSWRIYPSVIACEGRLIVHLQELNTKTKQKPDKVPYANARTLLIILVAATLAWWSLLRCSSAASSSLLLSISSHAWLGFSLPFWLVTHIIKANTWRRFRFSLASILWTSWVDGRPNGFRMDKKESHLSWNWRSNHHITHTKLFCYLWNETWKNLLGFCRFTQCWKMRLEVNHYVLTTWPYVVLDT